MEAFNIAPLTSKPDPEVVALLAAESDAGLLKIMADREKDPAWSDGAFREFYARHAEYLWNACYDVASQLQGESWLEDMFSEAFELAYMKAGKFKPPHGLSVERETWAVRGWLGTIAANVLRRILRDHKQEQTHDDDKWEKIQDEVAIPKPEIRNPENEKRLALIQEGLETLNDREQHVLRMTFTYYRIGEAHQRLPNNVVQELAANLGTTPENLRKIRERALKKLNEFVAANQNLTEPQVQNEKKR